MHELIAKLKTPEECVIFEKNAGGMGRVDLAIAARKRAIELRALLYGTSSDAERECIEAIYAYEQILSVKNGKKTRAFRTWQLIKKHGIIETVERTVNREDEAVSYTSLLKEALEDYAFEGVVLRHTDLFSPEAVQHSQRRMDQWKTA